MKKLPNAGQWQQANLSDRLGSLWATKNVTLDETGYIRLSPRAVKLVDEAANGDFGLPVAIGRYGQGTFQVNTMSDATFNINISTTALDATENSGTAEPTLTLDSGGCFYHDYWLASSTSQVFRKAANGSSSATWTSAAMTLTAAVNHALAVFLNRNSLCVANGNVVKQYTETGGTFTNTTDLTIPSDFEVTGLAYNAAKMAVATQSGLNSTSQAFEAYLFIWDGSTTTAENGYSVGAEKILAVAAYKTSFIVLTDRGQLKFFNGGGFEDLAQFPSFPEGKWLQAIVQTGNCLTVDGDKILINIGLSLTGFGEDEQQQLANLPSGVWCYDPQVGLYHRYSASASQAYLLVVDASGANITTDIFTASSGTIPATGNTVRLVSGEVPTGFSKNKVYYIIKVSSTTFSLALTKELAEAGVEVDITVTNAATTRFHAYELVDYGVTWRNDISAIGLFGETRNLYTDMIFGGDLRTSALANNDTLCYLVPDLENRGHVITPRVYSEKVSDSHPKLYVKFGALKDTDSIVVKVKDRDVVGLPMSAPSNANVGSDELIFSDTTSGYTGANLDGALDHFNAGGELDIEFTAGPGAGQTSKITSITYASGTYTLVFQDTIIGATPTAKAYFIVNNFRLLTTITSDSNNLGYLSINPESKGKFVQYKLELWGSDVTIEELVMENVNNVVAQ